MLHIAVVVALLGVLLADKVLAQHKSVQAQLARFGQQAHSLCLLLHTHLLSQIHLQLQNLRQLQLFSLRVAQ